MSNAHSSAFCLALGAHESYKQRLGIEWDGCPACWEEDFAAAREVEEQAEMDDLAMDGRVNKRRKIL